MAASQDDDLLTIRLLALGDEHVDGSLRLALGWACHEKTMTEALASRSTVGQAVGILMERYGLDPDCGFLPT